jgi:flagellar FliL protein
MEEREELEAQPEAPSKRGGFIPLIAALVLGVGGGGAVGLTAVGPKVGAALAARATAAPAKAKGGHGGGHGEGDSAPLHVVDNLVVNPAGSGGSRFLLTSIALETSSAAEAEALKERDLEIRDAFLLVLASRTVDQLSDISARPALSRELLAALHVLIGDGVVVRILIPQFVIQ